MRVLAFLILLAPAAAALDADAPGVPARRAHDAVEQLPVEARVELRKMFLKYRDEVTRRLEGGWGYRVLSDAVIEDVDEPFQPARLLEDAEKKRKAELDALQAAASKMNHDTAEYGKTLARIREKQDALDKVRALARREKGICRDWSDDVWSLLTGMNLDGWTVDDRRRESRPYHTGAVACAPADEPAVCLVFDPWVRGKPDVFAYGAWDAKDPGGRIPADYFLHGLPEKVP
ncbi:MAG: hypothetical protein HY079_09765 [Elusimicrobia bacterium]|nr:hypothetical protein [Elusimicrobiota bacterium]